MVFLPSLLREEQDGSGEGSDFADPDDPDDPSSPDDPQDPDEPSGSQGGQDFGEPSDAEEFPPASDASTPTLDASTASKNLSSLPKAGDVLVFLLPVLLASMAGSLVCLVVLLLRKPKHRGMHALKKFVFGLLKRVVATSCSASDSIDFLSKC